MAKKQRKGPGQPKKADHLKAKRFNGTLDPLSLALVDNFELMGFKNRSKMLEFGAELITRLHKTGKLSNYMSPSDAEKYLAKGT